MSVDGNLMGGAPDVERRPAKLRSGGPGGESAVSEVPPAPAASRRWILLILPTACVLLIFLVVPMLGLARSSFYTGNTWFEAAGVSLAQYERLLGDTVVLRTIVKTLWYGFVVASISVIFGFPVGYSLGRMSPEKRRIGIFIVILPLTLSLVIVVFGWIMILGRNGFINSILVNLGIFDLPRTLMFNEYAMILVLVQQFISFLILSVMTVVAQIDPALEQAAANLRASRLTTFRRVIIPLAMPGIVSGFTLVFVLSVSAFITPRLIAGSRVQMIGNVIFDQVLILLNWAYGAAIALVMLAITLVLIVGMNAVTSRAFRWRNDADAR